MLNLGMTEIFCFAIIALLVLGPDKLPEAARFVAKWYGKIKKFISNIQNEIDRELRLSEFREEMQKEIEKITELERRLQQQIDAIKSTTADNSTAPSAIAEKTALVYSPHVATHPIPFVAEYAPTLSQSSATAEPFATDLKIAV